MVTVATNLGDKQYGESIHACIFKFGFESENYISNVLIKMYMKIGSLQNGWTVINSATKRNTTQWNALLSGFYDNGTYDQGPSIFKQLLAEGTRPDIYTFVSIIQSCSRLLNVDFGKQVHAHILKNGLKSNGFVGRVVISMYSKCGCSEDADVVSKLMERNLFTWNVLISGYAQTNQEGRTIRYLKQMQREGFKPNEFTFSSCLNSCSSFGMLESGQQLHSLALKSGLSSDRYVANTLVDMYSKCRCVEEAEAVFKGLASRSIVSWNAIICGYSQNGLGKKALEAFGSMLDEGVLPDEVTFIGVLSACYHIGLVQEGRMHFNSMSEDYGFTPVIEHCACMVNILSRAGEFSEVERFVEEWNLTHNSFIWETILWACKMHGNVELGERAAEKLFELEPSIDYNYISLSAIYAANGRWDDLAKVRELMLKRGIKKKPWSSFLKVGDQIHTFFAQVNSHLAIKEIHLTVERIARTMRIQEPNRINYID